MKVYLAGQNGQSWINESYFDFYRLESFHNITTKEKKIINNYKDFLLDSGAFTFINNKKTANGINWDKYVERYSEFINNNNIELFFELDIDVIVGIKEVERLRNKLETLTNKKSIPVWHKSRGLKYWEDISKNYDYIAIGGIVTKEIKQSEYPIFNNLLKIAKENNCKVHGLGFTRQKGLEKYSFYSVDSTAWIYGNRGGFLYKFNGKGLDKIQVPKGKRLKGKKVAIHNFKEWVKYQKFAEQNL